MSLNRLDSLYQEVIMDHSRHPKNYGDLEGATHHQELLNPTCGDMLQVQLRVKDGVIEAASYTGTGCSISMASASMMTEVLKGKDIDTALAIIDGFNELIGGQATSDQPLTAEELEAYLEDAVLLQGVKKFPARYKCAVLAWKAAQMGLESDSSEKESEII